MGSVRITGGEFKGRKIRVLGKSSIRPTPAKVREAVFSILGDRVKGARVLDLFAGSGALGIEALSRGAREVTFVERDGEAVRVLREVLDSLGICAKRWKVVKAEARSYLKRLGDAGGEYDIVFMDPPYEGTLRSQSLILLDRANLVKIGGIVVCEAPKGDERVELENLVCEKRKTYGDTKILIYSRREEA